MRKYFMIAVIALLTGVMFTNCRSGKSLKKATGQELLQQDVCEKLQQEKPNKRAVGIGEHYKEMTARNVAEAQARAQFRRMISACITSATGEDVFAYGVYSSDQTTGRTVSDQGSRVDDLTLSIANGIVANTTTIKTSKYIMPDSQYKVYVCLEYNKSISELATEITKGVEQRISDEERMKMNFEFEQFRKRVEAELEKSKMNEQ